MHDLYNALYQQCIIIYTLHIRSAKKINSNIQVDLRISTAEIEFLDVKVKSIRTNWRIKMDLN